jgi:hypothetical protein
MQNRPSSSKRASAVQRAIRDCPDHFVLAGELGALFTQPGHDERPADALMIQASGDIERFLIAEPATTR